MNKTKPSFPDTPLAAYIVGVIAGSKLRGTYIDSEGQQHTVPCISFRDYMASCLYDDQFGYYRSGAIRVGKEGDFYTSSAVGDIMAEVIARYALMSKGTQKEPLQLVEWGAGTGRLSAAIAAAGQRLTDDWERSFSQLLVENHPGHAAEVEANYVQAGIAKTPPVLASDTFLTESLEVERNSLLVIANELLDAFPVHRIRRRGNVLNELGVATMPGKGFVYVEFPLTEPNIASWLNRDGISLRDGQVLEICADARIWLRKLSTVMKQGKVLILDYGHEASEYTAEHRMEGTLMTYWRHQASDSPFDRAGERDITAHVNFSFIRTEAEEAGFRIVYYETQKQFLIDYGALELLRNHDGTDPFSEASRRNRAVRQLLLSDEMSESFKVMILEKE